MMRRFPLLVIFLIAACTSQPKKETSAPYPGTPSPQADGTEAQIDYPALQRYLGLDRDKTSLGFSEKAFNTCDAGFGFSRSQNCRQEFLTVINVQLQCRDSEGTISNILSDSDISPLDYRTIRWGLKGIKGTAQSDADGFVQILTSSRNSQRGQRIRLAIGNEFLYMRSHEITKVITPRPWCNQR